MEQTNYLMKEGYYVTTVSGNRVWRNQCKKIQGEFYQIGVDGKMVGLRFFRNKIKARENGRGEEGNSAP